MPHVLCNVKTQQQDRLMDLQIVYHVPGLDFRRGKISTEALPISYNKFTKTYAASFKLFNQLFPASISALAAGVSDAHGEERRKNVIE